jgi:hypothetical protein
MGGGSREGVKDCFGIYSVVVVNVVGYVCSMNVKFFSCVQVGFFCVVL